MSAKLKYHNINWENGMKITRDNFIQQDNVTHERVQDVFASFLLLTSIFINEDFPTLDRPINANSFNMLSGQSL